MSHCHAIWKIQVTKLLSKFDHLMLIIILYCTHVHTSWTYTLFVNPIQERNLMHYWCYSSFVDCLLEIFSALCEIGTSNYMLTLQLLNLPYCETISLDIPVQLHIVWPLYYEINFVFLFLSCVTCQFYNFLNSCHSIRMNYLGGTQRVM